MKKIIALIIIIAAGAGLFIWLKNNNTAPVNEPTPAMKENAATVTIRMSAAGFEPKNITISLGDTVRFVNENTVPHWPASALHPTHEIYPAFDPKMPIESGSEWVFTFDRKGIWRFHDHLYPMMGGAITVE